ncbi:hypothetical protein ACFL2Z_01935 [Candidatus Eisenbacteria bacterium]|uniref:Uncharacterized protein n=1 Tax=Eiseniibacteriota bacterium TaxID=2212470 RepID=A0ABV6YNN0_UNCEI
MDKDDCQGQDRARLEHCPECDSVEMRNNLYFCPGQRVRVYVQCASCGEFVARYTLKGYTSNKSYESVLSRLRDTRLSSGKRTLRIVEGFEDSVAEEYSHVLDLVKTREDDRRIEEIIESEYPDGLK